MVNKEQETVESSETQEQKENNHSFIVEMSNLKKDEYYLDNFYVEKFCLPQLKIGSNFKKSFIEKQSTLLLVMKHGPGVAANLLAASKQETLNFKIHMVQNEKVYSVWEFGNVKIDALSFGELDKEDSFTSPDSLINCELEFKELTIDEVTF